MVVVTQTRVAHVDGLAECLYWTHCKCTCEYGTLLACGLEVSAATLQVHQFFVHDALLLEATPKAREGWIKGRDCAFVVHMRNLVDVRVEQVGEYDNTSAWMWMVA